MSLKEALGSKQARDPFKETLAIDYQKVFESAPALFLLLGVDEGFPILDASDGYLRATHTDRETIVGRPLFEVFPDNPEDEAATGTTNLGSSLKRVLVTGRPDTMAIQKYDVRRPSGEGFEERYWSPVNAPVLGPDGQVRFIIHRVEDVTELSRARLEVLSRGQELQEANRQLREATEQFQAMYDQGLFAARLRLDGTVADINRSAVEVCGFNRADILDQPFWECGWWNLAPDVQAWVRNAVEQAVSGEMFRGESRYFWGDGSVHIVDFACMPIRDASGRVVVAIATGMDITERVQGEQNQRALEAERARSDALAEIDRTKTKFFSNISHEFRTPLTLMLGPIEEAVSSPETPPQIRSHLELAHRNSLRLLKLVNSLLDFARIEAGRIDISYEATQLDVLTRDLASNFRSAMERAGLTFNVDCEDLGEPAYIDREMWEKIVLNLLSNAFKFTLQGNVTLRLRREQADAVLEVADTGVGVPSTELPRIFERFHRVEVTAGRTQEGSGIGLALVQELVKLHGGSASAQSELGRGTTFRVSLPLGSAHLPPERIKSSSSIAPPTATGAQAFVQEALRWIPSVAPAEEAPPKRRLAKVAGARILLADDNADMRDYVRDLLSANYMVEAVADGEQALEAVRRQPPDLVVADIMMPRLDGLTFLKRLRNDEALRDVPVMLLSARAGEEAQVEGLDAGADDYMVKPFSARELLARVGARLELTRMRKATEQALRESEEALRDADRRKDEFLAMLAHELRNPLAPIGNASELLSRTLKEDERAQTAVGVIKRQIVQMTRLVDDLLDVSRITQRRIELKKRPIELASVIAQTLETVEPLLREKRHSLTMTVASYEPLYVMGDFARLTQCVGNVLTNAIKYTEPGGEISVRTSSDDENVFIEIADNGTGIPPELLSRVFDLFVQSERTLDRSQGGLGIGLAVVRRLVEMHDGEVTAHSSGPGLGSTFRIRLPRIARPASTSDMPLAIKRDPKRVLVVDDNADAADSLSVLLMFQGHETQVAYSAKGALALVEDFRPHVALLDIGLPEMNGYELAGRLRGIPGLNGMRLVALTGYGQAEDYHRTQAAGFDDHLVKPVDLDKLEHAIGSS
jgi:PAS domain S-box-containing protein